jgi:hypothetical protein
VHAQLREVGVARNRDGFRKRQIQSQSGRNGRMSEEDPAGGTDRAIA